MYTYKGSITFDGGLTVVDPPFEIEWTTVNFKEGTVTAMVLFTVNEEKGYKYGKEYSQVIPDGIEVINADTLEMMVLQFQHDGDGKIEK